MMQEEILKELELWPIWTLKRPLQAPMEDHLPESANPIVEQKQDVTTFVAYQNVEGSFLALHPASFSPDEALLWKNITKAMQMDFQLLESCTSQENLIQIESAKVVMIFGKKLAQQLLQLAASTKSLSESLHTLEKIPYVVTFDVAHLLDNNLDKAQTWKAMCQAMFYLK